MDRLKAYRYERREQTNNQKCPMRTNHRLYDGVKGGVKDGVKDGVKGGVKGTLDRNSN